MLLVNYSTLISGKNEKESFLQPFNLMAHGIKVNMVPQKYGGAQNMIVEEETLNFEFCDSLDDSKLFMKITKPTQHDLDSLEIFELTSPYPYMHNSVRRNRKRKLPEDIPISEWRKRLTMTPE